MTRAVFCSSGRITHSNSQISEEQININNFVATSVIESPEAHRCSSGSEHTLLYSTMIQQILIRPPQSLKRIQPPIAHPLFPLNHGDGMYRGCWELRWSLFCMFREGFVVGVRLLGR